MSNAVIQEEQTHPKSRRRLQQVLQAFLALFFVAAGLANIGGAMSGDMVRLGYPDYFSTIIGVGYIIGVVCIYQTRFPFLQEWAYGAMAASLVGASASHIFAGDTLDKAMPSLIVQVIFVVSYVLRLRGLTDAE